MREQIARAHGKLSTDSNRETAIHETRKSMKRIRALLRLLRPSLKKQTYQSENVRFRDINRLLSNTRDEHVIVETIAALRPHANVNCQTAFDLLLEKLKRRETRFKTETKSKLIKKAISLLEEAKREIKGLKIEDSGFETVRHGFVRSYENAKTNMKKIGSKRRASDEAAHEWRKSVQTHWRHMALLTEAWPDFIAHRIDLAKTLSQDLGEDHDLAILSTFVSQEVSKSITTRQANAINKLITSHRNDLRQAAMAQRCTFVCR